MSQWALCGVVRHRRGPLWWRQGVAVYGNRARCRLRREGSDLDSVTDRFSRPGQDRSRALFACGTPTVDTWDSRRRHACRWFRARRAVSGTREGILAVPLYAVRRYRVAHAHQRPAGRRLPVLRRAGAGRCKCGSAGTSRGRGRSSRFLRGTWQALPGTLHKRRVPRTPWPVADLHQQHPGSR
jgi:hypothetical protein